MIFISLIPPSIINLSISEPYLPFQIVNLCLIIWCVFRVFSFSNTTISSKTITYLFIYIFFGIAPLYQFSTGISIWRGEPIRSIDYFYGTSIIFGAILVYDWAYNWVYNYPHSSKHYNFSPKIKLNSPEFNKASALIICLISFVITLYAFKSYPILLFFREYTYDTKVTFNTFDSTSLNLIYTIIIRPIPVIVLMYYNLTCKKRNLFSLTLLLITIITNFPLSLPRFYVAGLYLPLLFTYYKSLIRRPLLIKVLFIVGILYIFPFLNQGRTASSMSEIEISFIPDYNMFLTGHFDTFQNGLRVMRADFVTHGRQLLGVILFWFPRSIWPEKPIGSGGEIADEFGLTFDHIALNYWAEGWINFGFLGTILFSILLGIINAKLDSKFNNTQITTNYRVGYYIYLGMLFFILRGDLISCIAYMTGFAIINYISSKLILYSR